MHQPEEFLSLLDKYVDQAITTAEHNRLLLLIASGEYDYLLDGHFYSIYHQSEVPGEDLHPQKAQAIIDNIRHSEKRTSRLLPAVFKRKQQMRWRIAATVLVIVGLSAFWLTTQRKPASTIAEAREEGLLTTINTDTTVKPVRLADSSQVILQPGAVLRHPSRFTGQTRAVFLEGEAFFDVHKNADQPFFVYHHKLVTHVLGTSFHVRVNKENKQVEITVVTGTVQVYEDKSTAPEQKEDTNGVILTPNQKVVYNEAAARFVATLVNDPIPLPVDSLQAIVVPPRFTFEEEPLPRVLETIERTYGIDILVETDKLNGCLFTGNINKHPLYTKLDIICASVQASYQVVGTKILIKGKGCN